MDVLVAVPIHNEAATICRVIPRIRDFATDVLIVDDGSTDRTPELVDQLRSDLAGVIHHPTNLGYGQSLIDAFRWAASDEAPRRYQWVITMDCDEQHEPESLPAFFDAIRHADEASPAIDLISGSRYMHDDQLAEGSFMPPPERRRVNRALTAEINDRLGLGITDAFCGFKAHRLGPTLDLGLTETGYAFPMQLWARIAAKALRVTELPVSLIYNDPNRSFGGDLDDAERRLRHYREILNAEIENAAQECKGCCPCL
ncbi:MAG: dolichyl-phosphate mannose synthase [Phycisphaerae bacterium]|nr:dolichyl-phosphate mannose synthase [Phycisphaerae bacterium]